MSLFMATLVSLVRDERFVDEIVLPGFTSPVWDEMGN